MAQLILLVEPYFLETDKMNFNSVEKICSEKVLSLLKEIPESEATVQYLSILKDILDSFLNKEISVLERVYKMWNSVFFLRIWRQWIFETKRSVQVHFVTLNCYTCIELNAHELLLLIEKCRSDPNSFLPWLFSSQPCEKMFCQTRSMTTTYSTRVNYTLLDLLRRINKIEAINDITTDLSKLLFFIAIIVQCL